MDIDLGIGRRFESYIYVSEDIAALFLTWSWDGNVFSAFSCPYLNNFTKFQLNLNEGLLRVQLNRMVKMSVRDIQKN